MGDDGSLFPSRPLSGDLLLLLSRAAGRARGGPALRRGSMRELRGRCSGTPRCPGGVVPLPSGGNRGNILGSAPVPDCGWEMGSPAGLRQGLQPSEPLGAGH